MNDNFDGQEDWYDDRQREVATERHDRQERIRDITTLDGTIRFPLKKGLRRDAERVFIGGEFVGWRCVKCGEVKTSMWGDWCKDCS